MEDFIFTPIVLAVGLAIHSVIRRDTEPALRRLLDLSLVMHVLSGFAVIWVYQFYYGGGDIFGYHRSGVVLAELLRYDSNLAPEIFRALVQLPFHLPVSDFDGRNSTTTVQLISGLLHFICGDSLYAVVALIALASSYSKLLIFRTFSSEVSREQMPTVFAALMLMPSAVFWTSALLKEPFVMVAIGPMLWGATHLARLERPVVGTLAFLPSAFLILLLKPYVLLCIGIAVAIWIVWSRVVSKRAQRAKPIFVVLGILALVGVVLGISSVVPQLGVSQMGESMVRFRQNNALEEGGSTYYLNDPAANSDDPDEASLLSQLRLAPLGLATALYRPALWEARNPMLLINSFETTWLAVLTIQLVRQRRLRLTSLLMESPLLAFCASFTLLLGLGTGLASSNLGSLSRYRAPMIPFFAAALIYAKGTRLGRETEGE